MSKFNKVEDAEDMENVSDGEYNEEQKVKKDTLNKLTRLAKLNISIAPFTKSIKSNIKKNYNIDIMCSGGQIALTACIEELLYKIIEVCSNFGTKDKSGLIHITRDRLLLFLNASTIFKDMIIAKDKSFDKKMQYGEFLPVNNNSLKKMIDNVEKDITLSEKAKNFIYYIVVSCYNDITHVCGLLLEFSNKKSLSAKYVIYAVKIVFDDNLANMLNKKISKTMELVGKTLVEKDSGEVDEPESPHAAVDDCVNDVVDDEQEPEPEDEPEPEPEPEKKSRSKKRQSKSTKKSNKSK